MANYAFAHVPNGDGGQGVDTDTSVREAVPVRELAREIVCIEEDVNQQHASGAPYHNVYSSLIQSHLPRLDDISAVAYNEDRKLVTPDYNLAALATIAAVSSPVAQMLFHTAIADLFAGGSVHPEDAISD
jgi:hypothetical protein